MINYILTIKYVLLPLTYKLVTVSLETSLPLFKLESFFHSYIFTKYTFSHSEHVPLVILYRLVEKLHSMFFLLVNNMGFVNNALPPFYMQVIHIKQVQNGPAILILSNYDKLALNQPFYMFSLTNRWLQSYNETYFWEATPNASEEVYIY